jgi:hypothetical protein
METMPIVVQGNLKPDGTLELKNRPALPSGPVEVIIRPLPQREPGEENWWQFLQRARKELEESGASFRTAAEIEAEREEFRSGDERLDAVRRKIDKARHKGKSKKC